MCNACLDCKVYFLFKTKALKGLLRLLVYETCLLIVLEPVTEYYDEYKAINQIDASQCATGKHYLAQSPGFLNKCIGILFFSIPLFSWRNRKKERDSKWFSRMPIHLFKKPGLRSYGRKRKTYCLKVKCPYIYLFVVLWNYVAYK